MLQLSIDPIIFDLQGFGGVSVYSKELINYFSKLDDVSLSFVKDSTLEKRFPRTKFYFRTNNSNCDIFHSTYYTLPRNPKKVIKTVTTVHDFTHEYFMNGMKSKEFCRKKYQAINHSDLIVAISNSTAQDVVKFVGKRVANKIEVVPNGISPEYRWNSSFDFKPFVLFVGSRAGYKNFDFCVNVVKHSKDIRLKICGGQLSQNEMKFLEDSLPGRFDFLGFVTNEDLSNLYGDALCLFYPSSYEGFGIPVIEAAACGCPVVALNVSSLPEVVPDSDLLLKSLNVSEALERIELYQGYARKEIVSSGLRFSQKFSWDNTFTMLNELYRG